MATKKGEINSYYYDPEKVEKEKEKMFRTHNKYKNRRHKSKLNPKIDEKGIEQAIAWKIHNGETIGSDVIYNADKDYLKKREGKMPHRWFSDEDEENFNRIWNEPIGSNYEEMKWMDEKEETNENKRRTVKLTESELKSIISESVKRVISEMSDFPNLNSEEVEYDVKRYLRRLTRAEIEEYNNQDTWDMLAYKVGYPTDNMNSADTYIVYDAIAAALQSLGLRA